MKDLGNSFKRWVGRLLIAVVCLVPVSAMTAEPRSEVLFVYPPDGWQLGFETEVGNIRFYEYLPAGQTVSDWTELITVQIVENTRDLNPMDMARDLRTRFITECGKLTYRGPDRLNMDGYLAARLYVECADPSAAQRPGGAKYRKHEVAAFQIIQGKRDIYVIERAWHGGARNHPGAPYGRADLWGWDGFWHGIEVCDAKDRDRTCFGLGLLSPEKANIFVSQIDPVLPYGCDYFRVLSILPDLGRPARPTMVVPMKLSLGPFGDSKNELAFVGELLGAHRQNRPAAVVLTLAGNALAGIYTTDFAKTQRDAAAMRQLLIDGGVPADRLHETVNGSCPGS